MKMVRYTRPDGSDVWLATAWVIAVHPAEAAMRAEPGHNTRIILSGESQYVQESVEDVVMDLKAAE